MQCTWQIGRRIQKNDRCMHSLAWSYNVYNRPKRWRYYESMRKNVILLWENKLYIMSRLEYASLLTMYYLTAGCHFERFQFTLARFIAVLWKEWTSCKWRKKKNQELKVLYCNLYVAFKNPSPDLFQKTKNIYQLESTRLVSLHFVDLALKDARLCSIPEKIRSTLKFSL